MILINSFESSCGKIDDLNLAQFLYSFDKLKLGLGLLTNAPSDRISISRRCCSGRIPHIRKTPMATRTLLFS